MGLIARLRTVGAALLAPLAALLTPVGRGLRSLGLADLLVLGGGVAFTVGLVQRVGWPLALIIIGGIALFGGIALALGEGRTRARR